VPLGPAAAASPAPPERWPQRVVRARRSNTTLNRRRDCVSSEHAAGRTLAACGERAREGWRGRAAMGLRLAWHHSSCALPPSNSTEANGQSQQRCHKEVIAGPDTCAPSREGVCDTKEQPRPLARLAAVRESQCDLRSSSGAQQAFTTSPLLPDRCHRPGGRASGQPRGSLEAGPLPPLPLLVMRMSRVERFWGSAQHWDHSPLRRSGQLWRLFLHRTLRPACP
jgi:hypothetical protein